MDRAYVGKGTQAKPLRRAGAAGVVGDRLEEIARQGAQAMLAAALEREVDDFLQGELRGDRNGHAPERTVGVGLGAVTVRLPRGTAPRSPNSITRLKAQGQEEYANWRRRRLDQHRYLYLWVDGVYLDAGSEAEKTALLTVAGLNEQGEKELLAMIPGYRESAQSWAEVWRNLRDRGLNGPMMVIGDGALGIWAAAREVWPPVRRTPQEPAGVAARARPLVPG